MVSEPASFIKLLSSMAEGIVCAQDTQHDKNIHEYAQNNGESISYTMSKNVHDEENIHTWTSFSGLLSSFREFMCIAEELISLRWGAEPSPPQDFLNGDGHIFGLTSLLTEQVEVESLFAPPLDSVKPGKGYTQKQKPYGDQDSYSVGDRLIAHFSDASKSIAAGNATTIFDVAMSTSVPYSSYHEWEDALRLRVQHLMVASQSLEKELLLCYCSQGERLSAKSHWERRVAETLCQLKSHVMLTFLKRLQRSLGRETTEIQGLVNSLPPHLYSTPLFVVPPLSITDMPIARARYGVLYPQSQLNVRVMRSNHSFEEKLRDFLKEELLPFLLNRKEEQAPWQPQKTESVLPENFSEPLCELGEASESMLTMLREAWEEVQATLNQQLAKPPPSANHGAVSAIYNILKSDGCGVNEEDRDMALYQVQYAFPLFAGARSGNPNSFFNFAAPVRLDFVVFQAQLINRLHAERQDRFYAYFRTESTGTSGLSKGKEAMEVGSGSVNPAGGSEVTVIPATRWDNMCHDVVDGSMAEKLRKTFYQNRPRAPRIGTSTVKRQLFSVNSLNRQSPEAERMPNNANPTSRLSPLVERKPLRTSPTSKQLSVVERTQLSTSLKQSIMLSHSLRRNDLEAEQNKAISSVPILSPLRSPEPLPTLLAVKKKTGSTPLRSTASSSTHTTSSRPVSGVLLPYIKPEELAKSSEMSNTQLPSTSVVNESLHDVKNHLSDNRNPSSSSLVKETTQKNSIAPSQLLDNSPSHKLVSSGDAAASESPLWKAVLEVCPTLSEELVPGIYLQDLHENIQQYPKVRSMLNQLSTKLSESSKLKISPAHSVCENSEQRLLELLRLIASELRARTLSIQSEMPFLPHRVHGILLANLRARMEKDASFQSLCSIRRQIMRGAVGVAGGIGYAQRLDRVEQCLKEAVSLLACTSGFPMISAEKAETSIATLTRIHDGHSVRLSTASSPNGHSIKQHPPPEQHAKPFAYHTVLNPASTVPTPAASREVKVVARKEWDPSTAANAIGSSPMGRHPALVVYASTTATCPSPFPVPKPQAPMPMASTCPLPRTGPQAPSQPASPGAGVRRGEHPTPSENTWRERSNHGGRALNTRSSDASAIMSNQKSTTTAAAGWARQLESTKVALGSAMPLAFAERATYPHIPPVAARTFVFNSTKMPRPLDLERASVQSAASVGSLAVTTSLREVYQQACLEHKMRPNTALLGLLPAEPLKRLASLDLSANYIGFKGVIPLLEVIKHNGDTLRTLRLSHNNLENIEVLEIMDVLLNTSAGDSLTYLDLSYNPISRTSGQAILDLCIKRPNISTICLEGTTIPRQLIKSINDAIEKNVM